MKYLNILLVGCLIFNVQVIAQTEEEEFAAVPAPPELPDPMQSGQPIEPEVTIVPGKKQTIEEYRHNGNLYMIKVIPAIGKPYYLIDRDGDGRMEQRMGEIYNDDIVPQWVLFSW